VNYLHKTIVPIIQWIVYYLDIQNILKKVNTVRLMYNARYQKKDFNVSTNVLLASIYLYTYYI